MSMKTAVLYIAEDVESSILVTHVLKWLLAASFVVLAEGIILVD